jgi:hypothetical protein
MTFRRVSPRQRERIRRVHFRKNLAARIEREREPQPPILVLSPKDIPAADRGELVWADGKGLEKRLFFEVEQRSEDKCSSLWLYGQPISRLEIWFGLRKGTRHFYCHGCNEWQQKPLIFPWHRNGHRAFAICEECFYQGTRDDHERIRRGSDASEWGPVHFEVDIWGKQKPLQVVRSRARDLRRGKIPAKGEKLRNAGDIFSAR